MKIAVIEKYKCSHSSYRAGRSGGEWDYEDTSSYSYNYYFYSDQKEIGEIEYRIIHNFLKSQNKSYTEHTYDINEEHILYDCERTSILAEKLNCQIFEPGISYKSVFEHKIYPKYIIGSFSMPNPDYVNRPPLWESYTTEIIEHDTLPVIKYRKLVKDQDYWKGTDERGVAVRLDKDGNLCHGWGYNELKISTLLVDRLIESGYSHIIAVRGNEWGVIDMKGNFVVKYQQYPIKEFYYDFCTVELNGYSSCINLEGELLMPFTAQELVIRDSRYAEAIYGDLKLLYDLLIPKLVLVEKYDYIEEISDSLIVIRKVNGTVEIYNHDSLKLNDETIEDVTIDVTNNIVAKTTEGWIIYDSNANILFKDNERKYSSVKITKDGYISLAQLNQNNYPIYGVAELNGNILLPCYSDSPIKVFQYKGELYYILNKYKKAYICNSKGQIVSPKYDFISKGREGICIAFEGRFIRNSDGEISGENGIFYAISLDGHVKFTIRCQYLYSFRNGYATIKQDYYYGKVNTKGEIVIPPKYDAVGTFKCGLVAACKYGMWGYLDEANNIVIGFQYKAAEDFDEEGKAQVQEKGFCATINTKGELLSEWERDPDFVRGSSYDSIDEDTYIRDGLVEAFNGDSSNYWNID